MIEVFLGIGAKEIMIEYSTDGTDWIILEGIDSLAQAPGKFEYAPNNIINLGGPLLHGTYRQTLLPGIQEIKQTAHGKSLEILSIWLLPSDGPFQWKLALEYLITFREIDWTVLILPMKRPLAAYPRSSVTAPKHCSSSIPTAPFTANTGRINSISSGKGSLRFQGNHDFFPAI